VVKDTDGNTSELSRPVVTLTPDATPPIVDRSLPADGGLSAGVSSVTIVFSESIDLESISEEAKPRPYQDPMEHSVRKTIFKYWAQVISIGQRPGGGKVGTMNPANVDKRPE